MKIFRYLADLLYSIYYPLCCNCKSGRIKHDRTEWTGTIWVDVYECNQCKKEFI